MTGAGKKSEKNMETKTVKATDLKGLEVLASAVRNGEVVAFPTETVYGLGGNASDPSSIKKIYEAKGRPSDNPLIVHIWNKDQIPDLVSEITPVASKLIDAFMPGPITVIMKKDPSSVCDEATAGLDTVGIRMPSDKGANDFLRLCDIPVAAPSANLSGSPSPTNALHVINDMDGRIYGIIDGGECEVGLESTVVDATGTRPVILRPGAITEEMISKALGTDTDVNTALKDGETPKAPGMKYRHYAPDAEVIKIDVPTKALESEPVDLEMKPERESEEDGASGDSASAKNIDEDPYKKMSDDDKQMLFDIALPYIMKSKEILKENPVSRIGIFAGREVKAVLEKMGDKMLLSHLEIYTYGAARDVENASHFLFDALRHLDVQEVNVILAASFPEEGFGRAYMNRLNKASGKSGQAPSEAGKIRPSRHDIPLDSWREIFTASVLFVSDDDRSLGAVCEVLMRDMLDRQKPFCSSDDLTIGAELYCESAGIYASDGETCDEKMSDIFKDVTGLSLRGHLSTRANASIYDDNDLIIAVHDDIALDIISAFPDLKERVFSISSYAASKGLIIKDEKGRVVSVSIPDPRGENEMTYVHTIKAVKAWLEILFPYIIKDLGAARL